MSKRVITEEQKEGYKIRQRKWEAKQKKKGWVFINIYCHVDDRDEILDYIKQKRTEAKFRLAQQRVDTTYDYLDRLDNGQQAAPDPDLNQNDED